MAQMIKIKATWVQSLRREDLLVKGMASHSSILAWRIPWTEEPGGLYSPWGHKELDTTERLTLSIFHILYISSKETKTRLYIEGTEL